MNIRNLVIIGIVASISVAWAGATTEYSWDQLDQSFEQTIKVPLIGKAILNVDIPAEHLEKSKILIFRMVLATSFRTEAEDHYSSSGFSGFTPTITVNGSRIFGVYPIRFKFADGVNRSNGYVKIKSKHLKPGLNSLSFDAKRNREFIFSCGGERDNCTAIFVHKIWLDE